MLFPRRLNATTIQPDEVEYRWSTDYEESRYFIPPEVSDEDVEMRSQSGSQEDFRAAQGSPVLPRTSTEPAQEEDRGEGPSTQAQAASSSTAAAPLPGVNPLIDAAARRRQEE
ncbi:hypothetical protein EST38_g13027 [Candolleomyces aberdarensis]|uniref:Uncharacterized protein n=1 Tax=Candolleomyces aberdarensis TaxID=2316362 RepID=A0A4Q2D0X5_9AGAR|nr:hypothetical protein EST38_g13027 [Candolleomyces aberdarensis]